MPFLVEKTQGAEFHSSAVSVCVGTYRCAMVVFDGGKSSSKSNCGGKNEVGRWGGFVSRMIRVRVVVKLVRKAKK